MQSREPAPTRDHQDICQMFAEPEAFSGRLFMDRKATMNCRMAVENLADQIL